MANHAYVKKGFGTCVTDVVFTSRITDAFGSGSLTAGNVYDSVQDAYTYATSLGAGDFVFPSNLHNNVYSAHAYIDVPSGVTCASVDDTAANVFKAGATEDSSSSTYAMYLQSNVAYDSSHATFIGMRFITGDNFYTNRSGNTYRFYDCYVELAGSAADQWYVTADGVWLDIKNSTLKFNYYRHRITIGNGSRLSCDNVVFDFVSTDMNYNLILNGYNGGGHVEIRNSDLSGFLSPTYGASFLGRALAASDFWLYEITRCITNAYTLDSSGWTSDNFIVNMWSCHADDGYYTFKSQTETGVVLESTTVKRTGGAHYDQANPTTTLFSAEFQPNSNVVAYTQPLRIPIKHFELDLTSANTLTFHLAFADDTSPITAFNNDEAWIEIVQNSTVASSKALGETISTKPADILATPTPLTASTKAWVSNATTLELDYTYTDKRQIAVDTEIVSGMANGQVTAYLCIAKDVSTLQIFCDPDPVVT